MKKLVITTVLFAATMVISMTSCSGDSEERNTSDTEQANSTSYYCPMECEGDKTYEEMGSCPVCGMDLVEKE